MSCSGSLLCYKGRLYHCWPLNGLLCFSILLANIWQNFTLVCQRYLAGRMLLPSSSPESLKLFMENPEERPCAFRSVLSWLEFRSLTVLQKYIETKSRVRVNNSSADQQQQQQKRFYIPYIKEFTEPCFLESFFPSEVPITVCFPARGAHLQ